MSVRVISPIGMPCQHSRSTLDFCRATRMRRQRKARLHCWGTIALGSPFFRVSLVLADHVVEHAMLKRTAASLIACALLLSGHPASACATLDGKGEVPPLKTRKPVFGDEVRLVTGFGMRRDPMLPTLKMHAGIGWAAPRGAPVVAANGGRVVSASVVEEYGNTVILDHGGGWQTLYAHLDTLVVHEGDCVEALAVIGGIGSTGLAYGPRLYFEVRRNGQAIDPLSVPVEGQ